MVKTLLFDLDDTLLDNEMGTFLPAYFQALVQHLELGPDAQPFLTELINGTRAMRANTDPTRTLQTVFSDHFFPALGWDPAAWHPRFDSFYRLRFPELRALTSPRPAARAVMEWAFASRYEVVIATSPLFPMAAIQERLRWADVDDFPYALITSYETSHYAKPNPEYYAEILARLGRRPEEALLVGNDWADDIEPAAALGLPPFFVTRAGSASPHASRNGAHPIGLGTLETFLGWAQASLASLEVPPPPPRALPYLLAGNLAAAVGLVAEATGDVWARRPAEGEWSSTEIVCHLRDVDREVHHARIRTVLELDDPFIAAADTDPWAEARLYRAQSGPQALQEFVATRKELYTFLAALPPPAWMRPARHAIFGPTHLAEIVGWIVDHDRIHLEQLRRAGQP
jgi:FMN phosphatase YigB (HAD superfamily)